MKNGAVAVFVKTPGLSPVKTRLANQIGRANAEGFYRRSCRCVADSVLEACQRSPLPMKPYWAVAEEAGLENDLWSDGKFERLSQGEGHLGERLSKVYSALKKEHDFVILLGADMPQISPEVIDNATRELTTRSPFTMGMSEDGGFYLFGGRYGLEKRIWTSIEYSQSTTGEAMQKKIADRFPLVLLERGFDVDYVDDLVLLRKQFSESRNLTSNQRSLLDWMNGFLRGSREKPGVIRS